MHYLTYKHLIVELSDCKPKTSEIKTGVIQGLVL